PTARHLCRTPGTSGHRPPGASGAHCAVLDPFILQRRRPAHRRFARKFRRGLVACFLPKDAMTPKLSRDTSMHGDAASLRRPAPCERVDVETRLFDLAINDTEAELLVVLRGTVRPWGGPGRGLWRVQLEDGHHRIVSAQSVIAVRPVRTRTEFRASPEGEAADRYVGPADTADVPGRSHRADATRVRRATSAASGAASTLASLLGRPCRSWNEQPAARLVGSATHDASASAALRAVTPEKIDLPASAPGVARFLRRARRMTMHQEVRR